MKLTRTFPLIVLFLAVLLLSACAKLEVGVETTPSPNTGAVATAVASTMQAVQPTEMRGPSVTPTLPADPTTLPYTPESSPTPQDTPTDTPFTGPVSPIAGLIYRLEDQIYRVGADGQAITLTPWLVPEVLPGQFTPRAVFSPDGKTIISWWDFSDLWLVDLTRGQAINLTNTPDRVEYAAQYWPGKPDTIVFLSQSTDDQGPGGSYLTTIQLDGSGYRVLDETGASIGKPALFPNGSTIAYDRDGEAWLYSWDTGPTQLNLAEYKISGPVKLANPTWSPTGKYLAWMAVSNPGSGNSETGVALFDMAAKSYRLLHTYQAVGGDGWVNAPAWSPDGAWLAVYEPSQSHPGIWIMHPDGSGESQVYAANTTRSVYGLGVWWSADSQRLLVYDPNAEGKGRSTLVDVVNGQPMDLPLPEGAIPLAWIGK